MGKERSLGSSLQKWHPIQGRWNIIPGAWVQEEGGAEPEGQKGEAARPPPPEAGFLRPLLTPTQRLQVGNRP